MPAMDDTLRVGLGTAPLASSSSGPLWWGPQDRGESVATIRAAIDAGTDFIDTAPFYGWGLAERLVGEAVAGLDRRPPIFSKCGTVRQPDGTARDDASPDAIRADVETGLDRLGVDRIDVVQIHDPDPTVPIERSWECLMGLVEDGLIGGAGLSNHPLELMQRAHAVGPIAVVQHQYSLLDRRAADVGLIEWCRANAIPFLGWAPLASGFLVDDFDLDALADGDLRRGLRWASDGAEVTRRVRSVLATVAARRQASMVETAIAWSTRFDGVAAIVGARTPPETRLFASPRPALTDQDVAELDAALDG